MYYIAPGKTYNITIYLEQDKTQTMANPWKFFQPELGDTSLLALLKAQLS